MDANGSKIEVFKTQRGKIHFMFVLVSNRHFLISWVIDASSLVWSLIDKGKLANQIARLGAIVVKYSVPTLYFAVTISHVLLIS